MKPFQKKSSPRQDAQSKREQEDARTGETLLSHLFELRDRLLRMVLAVLVVFLVLFPFANPIYSFLADPLMAQLPEGSSMIAIDVAAPFLVPFKLVFLLAIVISIPYLLYQLWAFIAPGLYDNEKVLAGPLVFSSTLLFYLGMAFAYFVVFPLIFAFFTATAPEGVAVMTDISRYLSFVIMLFIAFGIAFEMPIATILLVSTGATSPETLARKRPYVIVGVFFVGMVLTPPDIISQTLLALPMWLLFEIGLVLSRMLVKRKARMAAEDGEDDDNDPDLPPDDGPSGGTPSSGGPSGGGPGAAPRSPSRPYTPARVHGLTAAGAGSTPVPAASNVAKPADGDHYIPLSGNDLDAELDRAIAEQEQLRNRALGARARAAAAESAAKDASAAPNPGASPIEEVAQETGSEPRAEGTAATDVGERSDEASPAASNAADSKRTEPSRGT